MYSVIHVEKDIFILTHNHSQSFVINLIEDFWNNVSTVNIDTVEDEQDEFDLDSLQDLDSMLQFKVMHLGFNLRNGSVMV